MLRRFLASLGIGTLLGISLPLLVAFLWVRLFGLPDSAKNYLLGEMERRHVLPFPVAVDRFRLDATGAILADHVTVFRDEKRESVMLQVDQVRVSVAWLSWWRGRGLINDATIANAEVRYPIGPQDTADFHQVNAEFAFDGRDIKIENAQAQFSNLVFYVRGTLHNEGFPHKPPITPEQLQQREAIFRSVSKAMADIGAPQPIEVQLEFETSTRDLGGGRANFLVEGNNLTWRSAPVDEISLHGSLGNGVFELSDFKIALPRGEFSAFGEWNLAEKTAELQFSSTMDFTTLAPAFPGPLGQALRRLEFPNSSPAVNGQMRFDLHDGLKSDLQADVDWRDFTFNGVAFSRLAIPLAYNGKQLLIPGLSIQSGAGNVDLELYLDKTKTPTDMRAKIDSSLDPTVLKGVFGEGMDRFLNSLAFPGGGPKIQATATGTAFKTDAWSISGKMATGKFVYKNAAFNSAGSDFTFIASKLTLPNLVVHRTEGDGSGEIVYDFKNRAVDLHNLITQVNVAEVAPIMGPKFTEYTKPYHFARPPLVHANGHVDLQDQKKELDTDLTVQVDAHTPMEWTLFRIPYVFDDPVGVLSFKNRRLTVNMKQCGFYDGSLTGTLDMDLRRSPAGYVLDMNLAKVNFKKFMVRTFNYAKSTGDLTVTTHLTGQIGKMETMSGGGEVKISNGDIAEIPFLGSLTPLIPLLSAANAAHGHFTAAKGVIHTDDLHISSLTLALIGNGDYNFIKDNLELNMRVNANGPAAILLFIPSKIFEFHGTGPMKDVKWSPKNL